MARHRDHHREFAEELAAVISRDFPEVCLYVYGSFARGEHDSRKRSDIDGGFIFPGGVVLPQDRVLALGNALAEIHGRHKIKLQFNLLDATTGKDGRFLSYTDDYTQDLFGVEKYWLVLICALD